jgi:hypothetical protein
MAECRQTACTGTTRKACRDTCRAVTGCRAGAALVRTVANVVTECGWAPGGETIFTQRLEIKRGDCAPTVVGEVRGANGAAPQLVSNLCSIIRLTRNGAPSVLVGLFQRLGVSPNGRTVLFELSDQNRGFPGPPSEFAGSGIFAVRADGSVRSLGAASRARPYVAKPDYTDVRNAPSFHFSPNGRFALFSDRARGADGFDATQFMVLDMVTGERTQVTSFAGAAQSDPTALTNPIIDGRFINDDKIAGIELFTGDGPPPVHFTVRRDGTDFQLIPPRRVEGSTVEPNFQVTGGLSNVVPLGLPILATGPFPELNALELFLIEGDQTLQLTRFGRSDTGRTAIRSRSGGRILFAASADPFQKNPTNTCQFFSIDPLGGGLRQLTRFDSGAPSPNGCQGLSIPPTCGTTPDSPLSLDVAGRTLMFPSNCDPFGQNLVGSQIFAMHPDGSGLRQVTHYRGTQTASDGTVSAEIPGPIAFSGFSGL